MVRKRDKGKCQMPGCRRRGQQVHHIARWADNILLRYEPSNGILLCRICHKSISKKESFYIELFRDIVHRNSGGK